MDSIEKALELEFWKGAFLMLAEVYRANGSGMTVSCCFNLITNISQVAQESSEYDVRSLRKVIKTLPMGCDANYDSFEMKDCDPYYVVYANEGSERYFIAEFDDYLKASVAINEWENQLKDMKTKAA